MINLNFRIDEVTHHAAQFVAKQAAEGRVGVPIGVAEGLRAFDGVGSGLNILADDEFAFTERDLLGERRKQLRARKETAAALLGRAGPRQHSGFC